MMPEEFKGQEGKGCGYTKSKPREWTDQEIEWIQKMRADGFSNEEIGQSTGRTAVSIQIKLKRIGKTEDTSTSITCGTSISATSNTTTD